MKTETLKQTLKTLIDLNKTTSLVACIWGKKGIGKTEIVKQLANETGRAMHYVTPGNFEDVGDLVGLPIENKDGETVYASPSWFPKEPNSILFMDELNRCKPQIRQALMPLFNQGRLLEHKLPEGCVIVCAANPPTDEYDVDDIQDLAWLSRFVHLEFLPEAEEWYSYTRTLKGDQGFLNFIMDNKTYLNPKVKDFSLFDMVKPDNRNITKYSQVLEMCKDDNICRFIGYGLVGVDITEQYFKQKSNYVMRLDGAEILYRFTQKDITVMEQLSDRSDILYKMLVESKSELERIKNSDIDKKVFENLLTILQTLPADLAYRFSKEVADILNGLKENKDRYFKHVLSDKQLRDKIKEKL